MQKMKSLTRIVDAVGVLIAVIIINQIQMALGVKDTLAPLYLVFSVIVLILVIRLMAFILSYTVTTSELFRKMVFGHEIIEGNWFDVANVDGEPAYALMEIGFANDTFVIIGRQFDHSGHIKAYWRSKFLQSSNKKLDYVYATDYVSSADTQEQLGFSTIYFQKGASRKIHRALFNAIQSIRAPSQRETSDRITDSLSGFFQDMRNPSQRYYFCGRRLTDEFFNLDLNSEYGRQILIKQIGQDLYTCSTEVPDALAK